ncbi:class I SAM-dependent methyltransferase [Candidatus Micrarchaeota archaeon]|nr:class I SAM-dependent methyltransferase [Candidatus Micrarchaeota archaeon]
MDVYEQMADFYDLVYSDKYDLQFYLNEAKKANGPVLEVACGTGRIYLELLGQGLPITGVDLSQKMLGQLVKKAKNLALKPDVFRGDMRSFSIGKKFKLIFLPYRSFLHMLNDDERMLALANFRNHLMDGGKLILHTYNPSKFELELTKGMHHLETEQLKAPDGSRYSLDWYLDYDDKAKIARYRIELRLENGEKYSYEMQLSYVGQKKMKKMFKECGFKEIKEYCGFDYGLVDANCKELIWVATK